MNIVVKVNNYLLIIRGIDYHYVENLSSELNKLDCFSRESKKVCKISTLCNSELSEISSSSNSGDNCIISKSSNVFIFFKKGY